MQLYSSRTTCQHIVADAHNGSSFLSSFCTSGKNRPFYTTLRASLSATALPLSNRLDQRDNRLSEFWVIYLGKGTHDAESGSAFQKT